MPSLAVTRRRLLASLGAGAVAGIAGCSSSCPDDDPPEPDALLRDDADRGDGFAAVPDGRWPAPRGDAANTGYRPDATGLGARPALRWRVAVPTPETPTPSRISSPIVADGRVLLATGAGVTALRLRDGTVAWRVRDVAPATTGATAGYGDELVPPVVGRDGTVVAGTDAGLLALDVDDGAERWRYGTTVTGVPAVDDGVVYVPTGDGTAALDAASGDERWTAGVGGGGPLPAVADDTVVVADDRLRGLAIATGQQRWAGPRGTDYYPVVDDGPGLVYAGSFEGLHALDVAGGEEVWTFERGGGRGMSAPVVAPDTLYVVEQPGEAGWATFALDPGGGRSPPEPRWCSYIGDGAIAAATDGQAYTLQSSGGPATGPQVSLVAFTRRFGEALWGLAGRKRALPPAVLDGAAIVVRRDGAVVALGEGG